MSPHGIFEGRHVHKVKSWPDSFRSATSGRKPFEIRRDDRSPPYQTGDLVLLQEFVPPGWETEAPRGPGYTGKETLFLIGYVERSACLPVGWCGFEIIDPTVAARIGAAVLAAPGVPSARVR